MADMNDSSDSENKFLVPCDKIAALNRNLLAWMVLRTVGSVSRERQDHFYDLAKGRGGLLDVRLVIEGEEFSINFAEKPFVEGWDESVRLGVEAWIAGKAAEIECAIRETLERAALDIMKSPKDW